MYDAILREHGNYIVTIMGMQVTSIRYQVSGIGNQNVEIYVYNLRGQKVRTLVDDYILAGVHQVVWDGRDDDGNQVSSGIYLYMMRACEFISVRRMLLMK